MKKEDAKRIVLQRILGNKVGVSVYMSPTKLTTNAVLSNWTGPICPGSNTPMEDLWFAYIDHMPNANFEHPVEYVFINDKTGVFESVRGTSPPNNIEEMEKVR